MHGRKPGFIHRGIGSRRKLFSPQLIPAVGHARILWSSRSTGAAFRRRSKGEVREQASEGSDLVRCQSFCGDLSSNSNVGIGIVPEIKEDLWRQGNKTVPWGKA